MKKLTVVFIPEGASSTKQFSLPTWIMRGLIGAAFLTAMLAGFLIVDYIQLQSLRADYYEISAENEGLKGEARLLITNLEEVKRSLRRVQDYTSKLGELTQLKVVKVAKKTGIGPLTPEEYDTAKRQESVEPTTQDHIPLGINMENLEFRPVFDRLKFLGEQANQNALELQQLLSTLSQQKSLLKSVPSVVPVTGWIASGFGPRISPFTGKRTMHLGIDVAAPIGTPIYAPADGVVIFSGSKAGFGNFIMIAHGYGVISRYGHNAQNMVQPGQRIKRGEQIATIGMTGRTTGPHLHYEVMVNGRHLNPRKFILDITD